MPRIARIIAPRCCRRGYRWCCLG